LLIKYVIWICLIVATISWSPYRSPDGTWW